MFERRLLWFCVLLVLVALVITGRLLHIQVVQAAQFEALAERILTRPVRYLPAPRGAILDRTGRVLVCDEPTFDVRVHYAILAGQERYLYRIARRERRRDKYPPDTPLRDIVNRLQLDMTHSWSRLSALTGTPPEDLAERAAALVDRVERIRAVVQRNDPTITSIAEENQHLPICEGLDSDTAITIRLELEDYPWLRVTPSAQRTAFDADSLSHILGRLGQASAERIAEDPLRDDELRRLRAGDYCGVSGIERAAERSLRGTAGRVIEDYERDVIERVEPIPGRDVFLTIDLELQDHTLGLLDAAVRELPRGFRSGAAAVVIDAESREVLALVSYPAYAYATYRADYDRLRRDRLREPLMARAVRAVYPPGSTCKAITLVAGLGEAVVTEHTRFHCTGHLLPDKPHSFRCWIYNQNPGVTHDMVDDPRGQDGESAVRNSCNIYFFKVGGLLGPARLCEWFERFGLGRTQGTGLIEESPGIVPNEAWLSSPERANPRRFRHADAWNFAIGQGEVSATPLQVANVAATVAAGYWSPIRLAHDDRGRAIGAPPEPVQSFAEAHLQVLRRGMWRVVNERGGTATRARLRSDDYEICGKTGSAQTVRRVVRKRYTFEWDDGRRESVVAISRRDAEAEFDEPPDRLVRDQIVELYPHLEEGEKLPAHAWFMGYTQQKNTPRGGRPQGRVYAISVIVEYGGSGGRVAGPVAKQIAEYLLERGQKDE